MKALVVSDTHRHNDNYLKVMELEKDYDMVIHCGDAEGSEYLLSQSISCPLYIVSGNNDFFSDLPRELEVDIQGNSCLITHGHYYFVSNGHSILLDEARARGFQIVFYGHTHKPVVEDYGDCVIINPGSLSYPRQEGRKPSYIVMEIDDFGKKSFEIKYL